MKKEIDILNIQFIATLFFILSLVISLILNYNEKLRFYNKSFLSDDLVRKLSLFNRVLIVILGFIFLYCNFITENNKYINLQICANVLSIISALIVLYVVYVSQNNDFGSPNL